MTARDKARELWKNDSRVKALYDEARKQHGKRNFCKNQFWYASPGPSGPVGLKFLMLQIPLGDAYDHVITRFTTLCHRAIMRAVAVRGLRIRSQYRRVRSSSSGNSGRDSTTYLMHSRMGK